MIIKNDRIVITGVGILSPLGIGKDAHWQGMKDGRIGFKEISSFDNSQFKIKVGGEVPGFNPKEILGRVGLVDLDRASMLLSSAMKFLLEDSGLEISEVNSRHIGISVGTTFGSLNSITEFDKSSLVEGPHFVNPSRFPNTVINSPASRAAIRFAIKGFNTTVSSGFCAGLDAIDYAIHALKFNRADMVLAGAVEEISFQTFLGFYRLGYLSGSKQNSTPTSRPFDKNRDGIVFGEGSTCILLEKLESALKRKARIYAEILSVSSNFNPVGMHRIRERAEGVADVMKSAIRKSGLSSDDIDCIFANANSTMEGDIVEAEAINRIFVNNRKPVTAIKSLIGETFSLSGAINLASALGSMEKEFIPPIKNYQTEDHNCNLNLVLNYVENVKLRHVMINCFDPSGANTVVIIRKYQEEHDA